MNSLLSLTSDRTGLTKNSSLTLKSVTVRKSALSADAPNVISWTPAPVRAVMHPNLSSTKITARKDNFSARSVMPGSLPMKAVSPL